MSSVKQKRVIEANLLVKRNISFLLSDGYSSGESAESIN